MTVRETVNASKERFGEKDLEALFEGASKIIVAKGKKLLSFNPKQDAASEIYKAVLGPSGNLRAPSLRLGKTWLVGFSELAYGEKFD